MSKHEELIKSLRASAAAMPFDAAVAVQYRAAADALEAQAREVEGLRKDAERWNKVLMHVGADNLLGGAQYVLRGIHAPMNVMQGSVAQHFIKSIDAAKGEAK